MKTWTKEQLFKFETQIRDIFLTGRVRAPIHLSGNNEELLMEIFKEVKPEDFCLSTHRSHYHALLKGVPPKLVKAEILAGRSMHLAFNEYNFLASAIIGGIAPIAVGIAMGIKMKGEGKKVWCFLGDMAAEMGIAHESIKYARNFDLPVCFVIEDNKYSTDTPTAEVWGIKDEPQKGILELEKWGRGKVLRYSYNRFFPHVGVGTFIHF